MCQYSRSEYLVISRRDHQVPQEIPTGESLYQPARARVPVHPFNSTVPHLISLVIGENDPQSQHVDDTRLQQRDDVYVPVYSRAPGEVVVYRRNEEAREDGRDERLDSLVECKGKKYLVDMVGQCEEREPVGKGYGECVQGRW